jgi:hypothetical protein
VTYFWAGRMAYALERESPFGRENDVHQSS